jgi:hypothetical protein
MAKRRIKITFKDGHEPTKEETAWLMRMAGVLNHPENAEPMLQRVDDAYAHLLAYGHHPFPLSGDHCAPCNRKWTKG